LPIGQWAWNVFLKGFALWAARPGNEDRAASTAADLIEEFVAAREAAAIAALPAA